MKSTRDLRGMWQRDGSLKALNEIGELSATVHPYDGLMFEYPNPSTGSHTLPTLSAQIQLLPPAHHTREHRHAGMTLSYVVMGQGATTVSGNRTPWRARDCFMLPPYQWHSHENSSADRAILFTVSDRPALEALGLYHEEGK